MIKKRRLVVGIAIVLVLILVSTFGTFFYFNQAPAVATKTNRIFTVNTGSSVKGIITDLKHEGYIKSELFAYLYARIKAVHINAGTYRIPENMTMIDLLNYLEEGIQALKKITLAEGLTLKKTAKILAEADIVSYDDFIACAKNRTVLKEYHIPSNSAEGYLYPDTYLFNYSETAETVLRAMLDNFFAHVKTIPNFPTTPEKIFETVVLASIVEREYRRSEEAPKIAGVFLNRLKIGMGLQSCATVEYIITEIQNKPHPTRLFSKDIKINHPYNTYLWRGLPPGAIANPGFKALNAVCNPIKSDFLYFRLIDEKTGEHVFSKTLTEHGKAGLRVKRAAGQ